MATNAKSTENEQKLPKTKIKDQCFVITPIGDDNSDIRRHIEGIIDAVIQPALEDQYEVVVAHRISTPGSITKQIIEAIYNSKLVIANLTNCNPNVMYELALRHGIGKPVIMIAEVGTKLPSDVMMQRTIFYRNDAMGVLKLRADLKDAASKIDFNNSSGLVFETLGEISHDAAMLKSAAEKDTNSQAPLEYIMRRLDQIEKSVASREPIPQKSSKHLCFTYFWHKTKQKMNIPEIEMALKSLIARLSFTATDFLFGEDFISINVLLDQDYPRKKLDCAMMDELTKMGVPVWGSRIIEL